MLLTHSGHLWSAFAHCSSFCVADLHIQFVLWYWPAVSYSIIMADNDGLCGVVTVINKIESLPSNTTVKVVVLQSNTSVEVVIPSWNTIVKVILLPSNTTVKVVVLPWNTSVKVVLLSEQRLNKEFSSGNWSDLKWLNGLRWQTNRHTRTSLHSHKNHHYDSDVVTGIDDVYINLFIKSRITVWLSDTLLIKILRPVEKLQEFTFCTVGSWKGSK